MVYIWLSKEQGGADRYFILNKSKVQAVILKSYSEWLGKHDGIRPKKPDSFHLAISMSYLLVFENNWKLVLEALG